jgi:anti-sigma factor RsiW
MNEHSELDLLSAYLDGELDVEDSARLDAHIPSCAECRSTLDALRATLGDLALLRLVEMDAYAVAALEHRLESASRLRRPSARRIWFSGAAAAAVIAMVASLAVVQNARRSPTTGARSADTAAGAGALNAGIAILASGTNYDAASARAALEHLGDAEFFTGTYAESQPYTSTVPGGRGAYATPEPGADKLAVLAFDATDEARLRTCAAQIEEGTDLQPQRYEIAQYRTREAFVLFYLVPAEKPTRAEVWILRPSDCFTLFFAQKKL